MTILFFALHVRRLVHRRHLRWLASRERYEFYNLLKRQKLKEKKKSQIHVVGFVIGTNKIFITTSNGRLLIIDIKTGKNEKIIKIDGNKISKPFIHNNMLFLIKNKAIIKFD